MVGNEGMRNIGKGRWKRSGILEEGKGREEEKRRREQKKRRV